MEQDTIDLLIEAGQNGHWGVLAGVVLMVLIWIARKMFSKRLKKAHLAIFSQIVAVIAVVAASLVAGVEWYQSILSGVLVGAAASGFWDLLGDQATSLPVWFKKRSSESSPE